MNTFNIIPQALILTNCETQSHEDAIINFAETMDSDMNTYFKAAHEQNTRNEIVDLFIRTIEECDGFTPDQYERLYRALKKSEIRKEKEVDSNDCNNKLTVDETIVIKVKTDYGSDCYVYSNRNALSNEWYSNNINMNVPANDAEIISITENGTDITANIPSSDGRPVKFIDALLYLGISLATTSTTDPEKELYLETVSVIKEMLMVKPGHIIIVYDPLVHDYDPHRMKVNNIEIDRSLICEGNPIGIAIYGEDLTDDSDDAAVRTCYPDNFIGRVVAEEKVKTGERT